MQSLQSTYDSWDAWMPSATRDVVTAFILLVTLSWLQSCSWIPDSYSEHRSSGYAPSPAPPLIRLHPIFLCLNLSTVTSGNLFSNNSFAIFTEHFFHLLSHQKLSFSLRILFSSASQRGAAFFPTPNGSESGGRISILLVKTLLINMCIISLTTLYFPITVTCLYSSYSLFTENRGT